MILGTSLIDMYGKCGRIEEGLAVFLSMKDKNVFTWNALISKEWAGGGLVVFSNGARTG